MCLSRYMEPRRQVVWTERNRRLKDCKSIPVLPFKVYKGSSFRQIEPSFPVALAGEEVFGSGLPVDELLAAAPPVTAKPSKFTHSGSEGKGEGQAAGPSSLEEGWDPLLIPVISPRRNKRQYFIPRNRWCLRAAGGGTVSTQHGAQREGCHRPSGARTHTNV